MERDPFGGDVKALRGQEWEGVYRRRFGDYRLLFIPDSRQRIVCILRILIRSEKTYR